MKKLIFFVLLVASTAWATAYNAVASGSYLSASTWLPSGTPGAADTVTIGSSYVVTCSAACAAQTLSLTGGAAAQLIVANGGTLTVGASTAGVVLTVGSGADLNIQTGGALIHGNQPATDQSYNNSGMSVATGGTVEVSGLLKMHDNITLPGGTLRCHPGGEIESDPVSGGMYVVQAWAAGPPYASFVSDATAGAHCTVTSTSNVVPGTIALFSYTSLYQLAVAAQYTDFTNCADHYGDFCIYESPYLNLQNVTFNGHGVYWHSNTSATSSDRLTMNKVAFRNISSPDYGSAFWIANTGATTCPQVGGIAADCTLSGVTVYSRTGGNDAYAWIEAAGVSVSDSAFVTGLSAGDATHLSVSNTLFSADDLGGGPPMVSVAPGGGTEIGSSIWLEPYCFADSGQKCRGILEAAIAPGDEPNVYQYNIVDAGKFATADNIWLLSAGPRHIYNLLAIGRYGGVDADSQITADRGNISHLTSVDASDASASSSFAPISQATGGTQNAFSMPAFHNSLNVNQAWNLSYGIAVGGYVPQVLASINMSGCMTAVSGNVLSVTACANTMPTSSPFPAITFQGLAAAAWLNGVTATPTSVSSTGWTATLGPVTHANYSALVETAGTAYAGMYYDDNFNDNVNSGGTGYPNPWNPAASHSGTISATSANEGLRLTFVSNGNSNSAACGDLGTAGTLSGTIPGDFVTYPGYYNIAAVLTVPGTTEATLGASGTGGVGLGAGNCANGETLSVFKNFWTSGGYGDAGKGANEKFGSSFLFCPTCNSATWDSVVLGGPGTATDARDQIACNVSGGIGPTGGTCTLNPLATVANLRAYLYRAYTPYNDQLLNAAPDGLTFGAVAAFPAAVIQ